MMGPPREIWKPPCTPTIRDWRGIFLSNNRKCCSSSMVKNGEMPIWDESPGFKSQMHKKSGEKEFKKTTREGHRVPHSDMRWLVMTDVRGRRDNSNNGKDLWTLIETHKSGPSRCLTRDRSPARLKLSGCRFTLTSVLKVNSDEVEKGALTKGRLHSWLETTRKALRGPKRRLICSFFFFFFFF